MSRIDAFKPKPKTINCILMDGGLGDHMASLVAIDYILKNYTWLRVLIWVPDYLLDFAKHVLPKNSVINNYSNMSRHYDNKKPTKTTAWDGITSPMKIHCLDYAFLKLCDENPSVDQKNYLQINPSKILINKFYVPDKYVVITTGYTAEVREFPAASVNGVVSYVKSKGYDVVFLGQTSTKTGSTHTIRGKFDESIDFTQGVNLIDKTSLLEAARIMHGASAVIGVDNGLLHLAGCTQIPIVGGFTTVSPELRMPVRNNILGHNYYPVEPDESLPCRFCQVKTNFLYDHNYVNCMYKDNLCTKQMTAEKFIAQLEKFL